MKHLKTILSTLLLTLTLVSVVYADTYSYYIPITIQETTGVALTNTPVIAVIDNSYLATNNFIAATGLNTATLLNGTTQTAQMVTNVYQLFFVPTINAYSSNIHRYALQYSPAQAAHAIITGVGGYVTTADNPVLEPGGAFQVDISGFIDTAIGASKNLIYKLHALRIFVDGTSKLTAGITPPLTTTAQQFYNTVDDGFIYATNATYNTAWTAATGTVSAVATTLYVGQCWDFTVPALPCSTGNTNGIYRGYLFFDTSAIPDDATLTGATLYVYGVNDYSGTDFNITITYCNQSQPLVASNYDKSNCSGSYGTFNTSGFATAAYNAITVSNLSIINLTGTTKLALRSDREIAGTAPGADTNEVVEIYTKEQLSFQDPRLDISYISEGVEVTVSTPATITTGVHEVLVTADGANLKIFVDDMTTPKGTTATAAVVWDNNNVWNWMQNNVMAYATLLKLTAGGSERIKYQPNTMIIGNALPNLDSGGSYPGAITWGTNPANITVIPGGMTSTSTPLVVGSSNSMLNVSSPTPGIDTTSAGDGSNIVILYPIMRMFASLWGLPIQLMWQMSISGILLLIYIFVLMKTREFLVANIVAAIIVGIAAYAQVYPTWPIYILAAVTLGTLVMRR